MILKDRIIDLYHYATYNIYSLVIIGLVLFLCYEFLSFNFVVGALLSIILNGYGLEITRDTIKGGNRLPKMRFKPIIKGGVKLTIIASFFWLPITYFIIILDDLVGYYIFSDIEISDLLLNSDALVVLFQQNPVILLLCVLLFILVSYLSMFVYEMSLATLAETNSFLDAFNFKAIFKKIKSIGVKYYTIEYTELAIFIAFLSLLSILLRLSLFSAFISVLILLLQFRIIGLIYIKAVE